MSITAPSPARHTAAGPYLGYSLQPVRLCYHLLTCEDGASVSIEHIDDVAIHRADGNVVREQTKSALTQNPLSDWAVDLWKTIHIWMESVKTGETDIATTRFQYYVTPRKIRNIAEKLHNATTAAEVSDIKDEVEKSLGKKKPACHRYLKTFLDATDILRTSVVSRLSIISSDDDPVQPLREEFRLNLEPDLIDDACRAFIGMAKEEADALIRRREPAVISADAFRRQVRAFLRKINLPATLTSLVPSPSGNDVRGLLSARPKFVQQLELIEASPEENLRAVSDFLRASADKTYWADKGFILADSLTDLDDDLIKRHDAIAGEIDDLHGDMAPETRGRLTYRRCLQISLPLEGRVVPGHFVPGCLHSLANSSRPPDNVPPLGWHPDYKSLLDRDP